MNGTIIDFRVREEMAGAVLKEVAALEPAERLENADSLKQVMDQAVAGLEKLWANVRQPLEAGVSSHEAADIGQILTRSVNLIGSSLELLVRENPALEDYRTAHMTRLARIKARGASLRGLVEMPSPAPDQERIRRGLQDVEKNNGVDAEGFLARLWE